MLYGHVETLAERVDHLLRLRELQDETGGFLAFVPFAVHLENTRLDSDLVPATAAEVLRTIAVSRLLLDNVQHIKAYWIAMGLPLAQVALAFGADDVQGTVGREQVFHAAGARTETEQAAGRLVRHIQAAGRIPVERDTLYNELRRSFPSFFRRRPGPVSDTVHTKRRPSRDICAEIVTKVNPITPRCLIPLRESTRRQGDIRDESVTISAQDRRRAAP